MKTKSAFVGLVSGVALAMSAAGAAADGTYRGSVAAPYSWSGLYVGLNAGYAWSDTDWQGPAAFFGVTTFPTDSSGGLVGAHIGYQHQWGNIVAGAEVSYSKTWLKDTVVGPVPVFPADSFTTEINDLLLVVGRLGYAAHNFLIYGKGGFASSDVELSGRSGPPVAGVTFSESQRLTGWTAGAGVEWMLSRNLILGVEYNYVHLDNEAFDARTGGAVVGIPVLAGVDDVIIQTVMARLSYKFGGDRAGPLK